MSGTTPPPPSQPPDAPGWRPGWTPVEAQPPDQPPTIGRRGFKALVLTAVLVLFVGGGAFAFYTLDPFHVFRAGPQAAEALPASAIFYAGVDLDPKAGQKVDAVRFLNHFPGFRDNAGLTDADANVLDAVVGRAVDQLDCPGLSYADDVRPWLGERFGVALMPGQLQDNPPVAFAVQVSDEPAARKAVAALAGCDKTTSGTSFGAAFDNGFMLVAPTQAQATAYAKAADRHALADDANYRADLDALGDEGVATMWVDAKAVSDAYGDQLGQLFQTEFASAGSPLRNAAADDAPSSRLAATFRFGSDHVELATVMTGALAELGDEPNPVVDLPDSTVFALSASGLGPTISNSWHSFVQSAATTDPAVEQQLQEFEDQTGIALPEDLTTIFGRNLMLSVGGRGLTAETLNSDDLSKVDLGLRLTNDPEKLNPLYAKIQALVHSATGSDIPLSKVDFDDGLAIASNDAYAQTLADLGGGLGDSDAFRSVVSDGADQAFVAFFDFSAVKQQILSSLTKDGQSQQLVDNLRPLRAIGFTAGRDGAYGHLTLRVSVEN